MSKHTYFPKRSERFIRACKMAQARGDAAIKWLETHELTPETKPEFDKLMKETNRKFKEDTP